jgi:PilZ domain
MLRRKSQRQPVIETIDVYDRSDGRMMGRIVDLTRKGMRVFGEEPIPLESTSVFQFRMEVPESVSSSKEINLDAAGVWCEKNVHPNLPGFYDSGFQFMNISPDDNQKIDKLIDSCTFDDWQKIPTY